MFGSRSSRALVWALLACPTLSAQVADQVVVYRNQVVLRFDRRLNALGETPIPTGSLTTLASASLDGAGRTWVCYDTGSETKLLRIAGDGTVLPAAELGHHPLSVVLGSAGTAHALTKERLFEWGPLYAVSAAGAVLSSNAAVTDLFVDTTSFAGNLALTPDGSLWAAADRQACDDCETQPLLVRVDPASGAVLASLELGQVGAGAQLERCLAAAPDGTLWNLQSPATLVHTDGTSILSTFVLAGATGGAIQIKVDAAGDLWTLGKDTTQTPAVSVLRHRSALDGSIVEEFVVGGGPNGFALGASGEDAFVVDDKTGDPQFDRLVRVNLVTGVRSSRKLASTLTAFHSMPNGDPTGFTYANVVDQAGDADGDGAPNRREVQAGSSPFDASSRPDGPKVYLSFEPVSNAITLTFVDPDGLLDASGGIVPASIELLAGAHGDIFPQLLHFVTSVQVSPNGKSGTIVFGGLPLADELKLPLEARVTDVTGAVGWDWAVTPPGDL